MRTLWINGEEYQWRVGRSHVLIHHIGKKFAAPGFSEVLGENWHVIEHDQHKGNLHITPADVAGYILSTLTKETESHTGSDT